MSMDTQYTEMKQFYIALATFNNHLNNSMRDLAKIHEDVSPLWQDEMRRMYDHHWAPLDHTMQCYLRKQGPEYLGFLQRKLRSMERYLYG